MRYVFAWNGLSAPADSCAKPPTISLELFWYSRGIISIIAANGGSIVREALTRATDAATLTRNRCAPLLKRAQAGDKKALLDLRRLLNQSPDLWSDLGNIALQARRSWIELAAGKDEVTKEALWRQLSDLTVEMSGPSPSMLERLVIGRVVTCWLQLHYLDLLAAQSNESSLRQREYLQRSQVRAQHQYLSAIRSLATVRRLRLPTAVQVNIGGQHVNVLDTEPSQ